MRGWYEGKVVLVTAAGSGIGRASALRFAEECGRVAVVDIDLDAAKATVAAIAESGGEAIAVGADMSNAKDIAAMVDEVVSALGRLDVAFNHAGTPGPYKRLDLLDEEGWERSINLNLRSVFLCMKYEVPYLRAAGGGAILNTSSNSALMAAPNNPDYQAGKAGVIALTRAAAVTYAAENIRVNSLLPGPTATPMMLDLLAKTGRANDYFAESVPLKRMGTPEELANAAVWICSDQASYVTGHSLIVDGGLSL